MSEKYVNIWYEIKQSTPSQCTTSLPRWPVAYSISGGRSAPTHPPEKHQDVTRWKFFCQTHLQCCDGTEIHARDPANCIHMRSNKALPQICIFVTPSLPTHAYYEYAYALEKTGHLHTHTCNPTHQCPWMKRCIGRRPTKKLNFFLTQLFDLRPDLVHFKGGSEDWRCQNWILGTFFWGGWIWI